MIPYTYGISKQHLGYCTFTADNEHMTYWTTSYSRTHVWVSCHWWGSWRSDLQCMLSWRGRWTLLLQLLGFFTTTRTTRCGLFQLPGCPWQGREWEWGLHTQTGPSTSFPGDEFCLFCNYSGFSFIRPAACQYNLNIARISELVQISEQPVKSCVT